MPSTLLARFRPALLLLVPLLAILVGRIATHSELAARHPRTAALLFLWLAADSLALALIVKAPRNRPGLRALLGAVAAGCIVAPLAAATPVREALLEMRALAIAMALTVSAYLMWSAFRAARTYVATRSVAASAAEVLPEPVVRFAGHELAMFRLALFGWGAQPDIPRGTQAFTYHRVVNPMIAALLVLQLIEIGVVHLLVGHWSQTAAAVLLALGVWGVLFITALLKAFRIHPILLDDRTLRVRAGTLTDLAIPLDVVAEVEPAIADKETRRSDVLNAAILTHPNVVLRLSQPLEYRGLFGRPRNIVRVAFRLDDPAPFLGALRERI